MRKRLFLLWLLMCFGCSVFWANAQKGYNIKVQIPGLKDSTLFLCHYFAKENSFFADDIIRLNKKGWGEFKGARSLTGGMYILLFPSKRFVDILVADNQSFTIEVDTSDLINGVKFDGSHENELFYRYRKLLKENGGKISLFHEKLKKTTSDRQKDSVKLAIESLNKEVMGFIKKTSEENPHRYISTWINSFQEITVPDFPRNEKGHVLDSSYRYNYWHKHFFDQFDLADPRLLRTPFYESKVIYYLDKVVPQQFDSLKREIDAILAKVSLQPEINRYLLGLLYNHYANLANQIVGMDGVFVYFAEKYYLPQATWSDQKFKENLKKEINKIKPNLIGNLAPELPLIDVPMDHFIFAKKDTAIKNSLNFGKLLFHENIKAHFVVLAFWEVDCGHCKKEIPLLYDSIYPRLKNKDVQIVAVHMLTSVEAKRKWVDFINDHFMYDWINAVPSGYEYRDLYNIYATPTIYLLDENKRIIAKRIGVEQLESVIDMEIKNRQHYLDGKHKE